MVNPCKGCLVFSDDGRCLTGLDPHLSETEQCPCMNCLVKMICDEDCSDYREYKALWRRRRGDLWRYKHGKAS